MKVCILNEESCRKYLTPIFYLKKIRTEQILYILAKSELELFKYHFPALTEFKIAYIHHKVYIT